MSHKTEYVWTCKIGGPAIQFQSGADAPMRQAVQAAFKQVTGNDEAFCFSGWGGELTEPERAVVENRLPNTERAAVKAAQPEAVGLTDNDLERIFEDAGGKWNGDMWTIEDADFHPAMRSLLASAPTEPMSAPTADPVADHCQFVGNKACPFMGLCVHCATPPSAATEPSDAKPSFREPTWKDEPPDWCSPKEEEIWQAGYDSAMASARSMNRSIQSGPVMHAPSGFTFDTVLAAANPEDLVSLTPPEPSDAEPDCAGGMPCTTCPDKRKCQCGCIRQGEALATPQMVLSDAEIEEVVSSMMVTQDGYVRFSASLRDFARAIDAAIRATKGGK